MDRGSQGGNNDGDNAVNDSQASATRILELRGLERVCLFFCCILTSFA